jgi:hypothetical protein
MTGTSQSTTGRRRRAIPLLIFAALCSALIAIAAVSVAGARDAKVLGKTKHTPRPACPKDTAANPCSAVGSVTAFMRTADGKRFPFKVKRDGKLVAWAIKVSRPTKKQRNFFGNIFKSNKWGKAPTARIAVLRQRKHKRHKYKLLRQSPTVKLTGVLGRKEIFTLDKPLRIQKGLTVALTLPTWASNFVTTVSRSGNQWRASRKSGECDTSKIPVAKKSRPQQKVGSVRNYSCDYTAARLLYWAYYVPG